MEPDQLLALMKDTDALLKEHRKTIVRIAQAGYRDHGRGGVLFAVGRRKGLFLKTGSQIARLRYLPRDEFRDCLDAYERPSPKAFFFPMASTPPGAFRELLDTYDVTREVPILYVTEEERFVCVKFVPLRPAASASPEPEDALDVSKLSDACLNAFVSGDHDACIIWGAPLLRHGVIPAVAHAVIISLQRLGRATELRQVASAFRRGVAAHSWDAALFSVTLGERDGTELMREATDEVKRCQVLAYTAHRLLTLGHEAEALAKMREAMALSVNEDDCAEAVLVSAYLERWDASGCDDIIRLRGHVEECLHAQRYSDGVAPAEEAVEVAQCTLDPTHTMVVLALTDLALIRRGMGDNTEATRLLGDAIALARKALGVRYADFLMGLNNQAEEHRMAHQYAAGHAFRSRYDALIGNAEPKVRARRPRRRDRPVQRAQDERPRHLALGVLERWPDEALRPIRQSPRQRRVVLLARIGLAYAIVYAVLAPLFLVLASRARGLAAGGLFVLALVCGIGCARRSFRWSRLREYSRAIEARYADSHRRALEVIRSRINSGVPFGVFLRNFEWYAPHGTGPGPRAKVFEERFSRAVSDHIQMIGVADHEVGLEMDSLPMGQVPRLVAPPDIWDEVSEEVIDLAAMVVVYCGSLTANLISELEMIRQRGKADRTLIVIGATPVARSGTAVVVLPDEDAFLLGEEQEPRSFVHMPATRHDERLAAFPMKIEEDAISSGSAAAEWDTILRWIDAGARRA